MQKIYTEAGGNIHCDCVCSRIRCIFPGKADAGRTVQ